MAQREEREQIRCANPSCPSAGGQHGSRIVVERGLRTGWYYKKLGKYEMVSVMPVMIPCEACGQHWLNPALTLFDHMTEVIERVADRLRDEPPAYPRRPVRVVA